ncbi:MAG: hypothetical protein NT027_14910 [Proteobacteria bacterium]|nr:hypothetical protein [Pseudomonadota bacterium]
MNSRQINSGFVGLVCCLMSSFAPTVAHGAPKKASLDSSMSGGSSKNGERSVLASLPIVAEGAQLRLHLEYNIANTLGLAVEGGILGETELLDREQVDEMGNTLKTKGVQGALLFSRYSQPSRMGGFFWTLGGGYRQYTAEWKKKPLANAQDMRLESSDADGYLHHRMRGQGTFGVGRVGYRYVADEWPLSIGGHFGLRHMTSKLKDLEVEQEEQAELNLEYSPTTSEEKRLVNHKMMTTPDVSIELGLIF